MSDIRNCVICDCDATLKQRSVFYNAGTCGLCVDCQRDIATEYVQGELRAFGLNKVGKILKGLLAD